MKLLIYSIFVLLIAPCNKSKQITATAIQNTNSTITIIYQTTPCFGRCPTYTMTINGLTKQILFVGKSNTEKIGSFSKSVTDEELTDLANAFKKANFFALDENYLGPIVDFPSKYITYSHEGLTKKVQDRSAAPDALHFLEKILETIANSDGWKPLEDVGN